MTLSWRCCLMGGTRSTSWKLPSFWALILSRLSDCSYLFANWGDFNSLLRPEEQNSLLGEAFETSLIVWCFLCWLLTTTLYKGLSRGWSCLWLCFSLCLNPVFMLNVGLISCACEAQSFLVTWSGISYHHLFQVYCFLTNGSFCWWDSDKIRSRWCL